MCTCLRQLAVSKQKNDCYGQARHLVIFRKKDFIKEFLILKPM